MATLCNKTLFVRNIPFSTTDSQLEAAFSQHGELKSCFTVKEKGVLDRCKGYGYVIFSDSTDAHKAMKLVKVLGKRPVQVSFANKKLPAKPQKSNLESSKGYTALDGSENRSSGVEKSGAGSDVPSGGGEPSSEEEEEEEEDDYESRTLQGAPERRRPRSKRASARFEVGKVLVLSDLPEGISEKKIRKKCEKSVAKVESIVFPVPERSTPTAYVTFSSHKEARRTLKESNGMSWKSVTLSATLLSKESKAVSQKTLKKSRLIVRNLSFKCSEQDVLDAFRPFGEVAEVNIPRKPNGHMLGYAFVQFSSFFSAKKAIEELNSKEIKGRPVAVDWVVPKQQYEEAQASPTTLGTLPAKKPSEEGSIEMADAAVVAAATTDSEVEDDGVSSGERDGSGSDNDRGSGEDESGSDGEDGEGSEGGEGGVEVEPKRKVKKPTEDVYDGKTVFIRNVPFMCSDSELRDIFKQFGRVRYGRLVLDPDTEMCRGSAFVQFHDISAVQSCFEVANSEEGLCCRGRRLDVSLALSRKELGQLKDYKPGSRVKEDKRNMYLAKEGVILPGSEAAKDLTRKDMAKRLKAHSEMKTKLANPNFFVSKTRLSVRNIPTQVDDKKLKGIFSRVTPRSVVQVKILRATDRVDIKGVGRSKGFAFIEFTTHEAALKALRALNNNPDIFGPRKRLLVEFAVEDSRVIKLREARKHRRMKGAVSTVNKSQDSRNDEVTLETELNDSLDTAAVVGGGTAGDKRAKWRLKWKERRLKRQQNRVPDTSTATSHTHSSSSSSQQQSTNTAAPTVLQTANLRKRRRELQNVPARQKRQKVNDNSEEVKTKGLPTSDLQTAKESTGSERNASKAADRFSSSGKRKLGARKRDKEEEEFAEMVKKYRRKFETSEGRWFD